MVAAQRLRRRQRGSRGGSTLAAADLLAAVAVWWHQDVNGGSRVLGAKLPPRAAAGATKTPVATAMAGALTTINNHPKAAEAMATETATMMTIKM